MGGKVLEHEGKTIYNAGREKGRMEGRMEGRVEGRAEGRNEGLDEARLESIRNVMRGLKYSAQQAMDLLRIPVGEQSKYAAKL